MCLSWSLSVHKRSSVGIDCRVIFPNRTAHEAWECLEFFFVLDLIGNFDSLVVILRCTQSASLYFNFRYVCHAESGRIEKQIRGTMSHARNATKKNWSLLRSKSVGCLESVFAKRADSIQRSPSLALQRAL